MVVRSAPPRNHPAAARRPLHLRVAPRLVYRTRLPASPSASPTARPIAHPRRAPPPSPANLLGELLADRLPSNSLTPLPPLPPHRSVGGSGLNWPPLGRRSCRRVLTREGHHPVSAARLPGPRPRNHRAHAPILRPEDGRAGRGVVPVETPRPPCRLRAGGGVAAAAAAAVLHAANARQHAASLPVDVAGVHSLWCDGHPSCLYPPPCMHTPHPRTQPPPSSPLWPPSAAATPATAAAAGVVAAKEPTRPCKAPSGCRARLQGIRVANWVRGRVRGCQKSTPFTGRVWRRRHSLPPSPPPTPRLAGTGLGGRREGRRESLA